MSRRLSIEQHAEARQRIAVEMAAIDIKERKIDAILHPAMDTRVDHPPAMRKADDVRRILQILDEIDREGGEG